MLEPVADDALQVLPHALHLAPVEDNTGQGHASQHHQGGEHAEADPENDLSPLPGLSHRLLQYPDDLWAQLVNALLHPENRDHGVVDVGEVVVVSDFGHIHVDLEAGLGTQSRPGNVLDVKPETMFLLKNVSISISFVMSEEENGIDF